MTLKDYSDLILALVNKVDAMWNHFFAANAGIIVWLTSVENEIPLKYRVFVMLIFCSYMMVHLVSHLRAYKFLNLALKEFKLNLGGMNIQTPEIQYNIVKLQYDNRRYIVTITYIIAILFVYHILWTNDYKVL